MARRKLAPYRAKRNFRRTSEPSGRAGRASPSQVLRFVVQKHAARRLHYDLRLELDGVFRSWAVTKGPSLDPRVRRLAVEVEDHPLDYGDFEGNIPKGNYGAGSVMLWDKGTFELLGTGTADEQIARGDLKFRLHGQKVRGEFALVLMKGRGKGNEWLPPPTEKGRQFLFVSGPSREAASSGIAVDRGSDCARRIHQDET